MRVQIELIKDLLANDAAARFLFERSFLTETQLNTYVIYNLGKRKLRFGERIVTRDLAKVSRGAFFRSLQQAQRNIMRSIYTMILLEYLGLLEEKASSSLLEVGQMLRELKKSKVDREQAVRVLLTIESVLLKVLKP